MRYMYVDPDRLCLILIQTLLVQLINVFLKSPTEKFQYPRSQRMQIRSYDLFSGIPIGHSVRKTDLYFSYSVSTYN